MRLAILVQRAALDVLHHEVRAAVLGRAAIEQPRDVGMREAGQDLPLVAEVPQDLLRIHAPSDQLERDLLLKMTVGADSTVDSSHAALRHFFSDVVWPNTLPRPRFGSSCGDQRG